MKNLLTRILAVVFGLALFVGAFLFSVVLFAVAFAVAVLFWGYVLWKTRHLRRQVPQRMDDRDVIEGTVISSEPDRPRQPGASRGKAPDSRSR
jgi:ABC-type bacteriocin/lantibiotic exporter with double-glycine peptidase domain